MKWLQLNDNQIFIFESSNQVKFDENGYCNHIQNYLEKEKSKNESKKFKFKSKHKQLIFNSQGKLTDPSLIHPDIKLYIISYSLAGKLEVSKQLENKKFQIIVCDESHNLKNINAKRTINIIPLCHNSKRVIFLSGTPMLNRPVELFPQLNCIRPDIFYRLTDFGDRYCEKIQNFYSKL